MTLASQRGVVEGCWIRAETAASTATTKTMGDGEVALRKRLQFRINAYLTVHRASRIVSFAYPITAIARRNLRPTARCAKRNLMEKEILSVSYFTLSSVQIGRVTDGSGTLLLARRRSVRQASSSLPMAPLPN